MCGFSPGSAIRRERIALTAVFAMHGFLFANWAVRIPAVKQQAGASAAALGLALLGLSAGAVAAQLLAGVLCRRFGSRQVTVVAAGLLSGALLLPPLAHSVPVLAAALLVFGAAYGCLNVAMNNVAVDLVAALRRPVMPSFHAAWSFGGLAGASLGGLLAPHLAPLPHLALASLTGALTTAVASRALLNRAVLNRAGLNRAGLNRAGLNRAGSGLAAAQSPPTAATCAEDAARVDPIPLQRAFRLVGVLGLIALCAAYDEGAIGDWTALHLKQDLAASAGMAAAGYAVFALAEATGRLSGTALLERYGHRRVLIAGSLIACLGILLAALAPWLWLALAGFAATGLGLANLFPTAVARAGALAGASGVALTATLGFSGFLVGPPLIGFLASRVSLRAGLATLAVLALVAAITAFVTSLDTADRRDVSRGRPAGGPDPP
jgi:MFS family permease